jgi:hypothetical protein
VKEIDFCITKILLNYEKCKRQEAGRLKKMMNGKMGLIFILRLKAFGLSLLQCVLHLQIPDTILPP